MNETYPASYHTVVSSPSVSSKSRKKLRNYEFQDLKHISLVHPQKIICEDDDRYLANATKHPNRAICRLLINDKNGHQYLGTGFLVSSTCVLTSGHCVYLKNGWAESIIVIPGANGKDSPEPYGKVVGYNLLSVKGWTKHRNRNFDYGGIILDQHQAFPGIENYLGYQFMDKKKTVTSFGYSAESNKKHEQWGSVGRISSMTEHLFYYDNDTIRGNSGSPIIYEDDVVVAIHSYGQCPNFGVRITPGVKEVIDGWKKLKGEKLLMV